MCRYSNARSASRRTAGPTGEPQATVVEIFCNKAISQMDSVDLSLFIIKTDLKADLETKRDLELRRYYIFNFVDKNKQVHDYGKCFAPSYLPNRLLLGSPRRSNCLHNHDRPR